MDIFKLPYVKEPILKNVFRKKKLQTGHLGAQCEVTREFCTMFHSSFMTEIHSYNVHKHV